MLQIVGFLIFILSISGTALSHRIETVRAIFITIIILIGLQTCLLGFIKLLISSNIVEEDKEGSENSSISEEKCFTLNRKWMTHYVPYTITIGSDAKF